MRTAPRQGSNSETIRRDNLSASCARSISGAPARGRSWSHTGLNRSTVAGIIAELADRGLALEEPGGSLGRPAPLPLVRASSDVPWCSRSISRCTR